VVLRKVNAVYINGWNLAELLNCRLPLNRKLKITQMYRLCEYLQFS
jgi:hypothetical protein